MMAPPRRSCAPEVPPIASHRLRPHRSVRQEIRDVAQISTARSNPIRNVQEPVVAEREGLERCAHAVRYRPKIVVCKASARPAMPPEFGHATSVLARRRRASRRSALERLTSRAGGADPPRYGRDLRRVRPPGGERRGVVRAAGPWRGRPRRLSRQELRHLLRHPVRRDARGKPGEIRLCSPTIMPGYRNRPDATAKAIVAGWYRLGMAAPSTTTFICSSPTA